MGFGIRDLGLETGISTQEQDKELDGHRFGKYPARSFSDLVGIQGIEIEIENWIRRIETKPGLPGGRNRKKLLP